MSRGEENQDGALRRAAGWLAKHPFLCAAGVGLLCLFAIAPSEYFFLPVALEPVGRMIYRVAYFFVLPFRALVLPFLPQEDHAWPVAHTIVVCLGAPYAYLFGWRCITAARRGLVTTPRDDGASTRGATRRQFLARSGVVFGMTGFCGPGAYGALIEPQRLVLRRYTLPVAELPRSLEGLRIVHVSDTHYGPFVSLDFIKEAVDVVNSLEADVVFLTGDYVHRTEAAIDDGVQIFSELESRYGTLAVLGNHDHWEDAGACREIFRAIGVRVLDNDRKFLSANDGIGAERVRDAICIGGVGDLWEDEVLPERAFGDVDESTPRLLLSHNPDVAEKLPNDLRVDGMFSGHTHGGQVRLPILGAVVTPSAFGDRYVGGYCHGPRCPVIVSRGVGLGGIPIRFGVEPEVGLITLTRS